MDLISYLRILRRRWALVVLPLTLAVAIAWATLPESVEQVEPLAESYNATATLITSPTYVAEGRVPVGLTTVALFATVGEVPVRAAKLLEFDGEPQFLATQVTVTPEQGNGTLTVSASGPDPQEVEARANAFARSTVAYFRDRDISEVEARIAATEKQLKGLTRQLRSTEAEAAALPDDTILKARSESLRAQYSQLYGQVVELKRNLRSTGPLDLLQPAVAIPTLTGGNTFAPPTSPLSRLAIAALLGALLGAALALVIERVDSRLRSREQVEDAFGLPVLAEIPSLPLGLRGSRQIVSAIMPASATAEAHRTLRSAVLLLGPDGSSQHSKPRDSTVLLVTSALPGEGKTTTVANLAAVMAEAGRRVLVLSLDLRNPRLHEYFEEPDGLGASDLLSPDLDISFDAAVRDTAVTGVSLMTSGERLDHPGALLTCAGDLLREARRHADVVLVDTPPVLTAADAVDLAQLVDVVLVVSRLNKTTTAHAAAAQRLLSRLGVPALGTVLIGSTSRGAQEGVYRLAHRPDGSRSGETGDVVEASAEDESARTRNRGK